MVGGDPELVGVIRQFSSQYTDKAIIIPSLESQPFHRYVTQSQFKDTI